MSGILVFDTETTGLLRYGKPPSDPTQPRMIQLGAALFTSKWERVAAVSLLIRQPDAVSNEGALGVHGISGRRLDLYGVRPQGALAVFMDLVRDARVVAAYPLNFDESIIDIEFDRMGGQPADWRRPGLRRICIRQAATSWATARNQCNGKSLKLVAAHELITGEAFEQHHDALSDALAASRVLQRLGEENAVEGLQ